MRRDSAVTIMSQDSSPIICEFLATVKCSMKNSTTENNRQREKTGEKWRRKPCTYRCTVKSHNLHNLPFLLIVIRRYNSFSGVRTLTNNGQEAFEGQRGGGSIIVAHSLSINHIIIHTLIYTHNLLLLLYFVIYLVGKNFSLAAAAD